jgi:hypothetical protein
LPACYIDKMCRLRLLTHHPPFAPQTLGLSLDALEDPPLGAPVLRVVAVTPQGAAEAAAAAVYVHAPTPAPAPQVLALPMPLPPPAAQPAPQPAPYAFAPDDMAAALAAARVRADAAEVSLHAARAAAESMLSAARMGPALAVSR